MKKVSIKKHKTPRNNMNNHLPNSSTYIENNNIVWNKFKEQIIFIEQNIFNKKLQQTEEELKETFTNNSSIVILFTDNDNVIGYICGDNIQHYVLETDKDFDKEFEEQKVCYIETINVNPKYQHQGYGTKLFKDFIKQSKQRNYKFVAGHFCRASADLVLKFTNTKILSETKNYEGTKQTYYYITLKL